MGLLTNDIDNSSCYKADEFLISHACKNEPSFWSLIN